MNKIKQIDLKVEKKIKKLEEKKDKYTELELSFKKEKILRKARKKIIKLRNKYGDNDE